MTGRNGDPAHERARARSEEEPGAHSGAEDQARERTIPGTASANEGYQPTRGTVAGNPLEGIEADDQEQRTAQDRGDEAGGAGRS
ncbi:hypothetical protein AB0K80_32740 [Streptomyces sp. NPDC052682]|uniref:hypothetical protein n=1 Tax=Streptomyces sp. NPDC052682 TaxID=3154954 RepID=UPI003426AD6A